MNLDSQLNYKLNFIFATNLNPGLGLVTALILL